MIKKAKIEDSIYDVVTVEEFERNRDLYLQYSRNIAIEDKNDPGFIYPIRTTTDTRPGFYLGENGKSDYIKRAETEEQKVLYGDNNIINFSDSKSFRDIIEKQDKLNRAERSILTTVDNITIPEPSENDTPFMKAIKTAIVKKHIDLDKYGYRFGNNYPNDKRLLKKDDMTLLKGIAYADCLDFDIYAVIKDSSPDVPNPIGEPIVVKLTGENAGFTDELNCQLDQITAAGNIPTTIQPINAAYGQDMYADTMLRSGIVAIV